ncbi:MAG: glycosyltransferase family 87 protein [Aggregatilineales bacterium]
MQQLEDFWQLTLLQKLIILSCLLAVSGLVIWFVFGQNIVGWDFRNNLWGPAHLLMRGESPYKIELLFDNSNSVWMPTVIGAFFPVGLAELETASNLWFLLNVLLFAAAIRLSWPAHSARYPIGWLFGGLVAILLFPSLLSHLLQGQISIVIMFALLLMTRLVTHRRHFWLTGLLLVLALTKPQLTVFALSGIVIYLWDDKHALLRLTAATLAWGAMLTLPLWLVYRNWTADFMTSLARNPDWAQPSSLAVLRFALNDIGTVVWLGLFALGLVINLRLWSAHAPRVAIGWSLALTTTLTLYVWTWDFVLLVPLLVFSYFSITTVYARFTWLAGYLVCWMLFLYVRTTTDNSDIHFWWYSWAIIGVVLAALLVERLKSTQAIELA